MPNQFGELASGIIQYDFDYITGADAIHEVQMASGWLQANVGQLNTLLYSTFYSGDLAQESGWENPLKQEEKAIYSQLYIQDYYNKQSRIILRNFTTSEKGGSSTVTSDYIMTPWTSLREGDTTISRDAIKITASSRTSAAKTMKDFADAAEAKLKDLVYKYNYYQAESRQVAGSDGDKV
jgi:hypothetical protein